MALRVAARPAGVDNHDALLLRRSSGGGGMPGYRMVKVHRRSLEACSFGEKKF
jgi:hypothetical protein